MRPRLLVCVRSRGLVWAPVRFCGRIIGPNPDGPGFGLDSRVTLLPGKNRDFETGSAVFPYDINKLSRFDLLVQYTTIMLS